MFAPYHRLDNCKRLEANITRLGTALIAPEALSAYNNYHFALKYKLKCASQYLNNLTDILTGTSLQDISADKELIMFNINMNMDGFFYSSGSALDILAREVLSYYGQTLANRVYFHTAYNELNQHRPQEAIVQKLVTPAWKNLFSDYRNALTHELIVADRLSIEVITQGSQEQVNLRLPLPDDPKVRPENRTFNSNHDVLSYTQDVFRRQLSLCNQIYGEVNTAIQRHNILPI